MSSLNDSFNVIYTEVVGAQRIRESKKGKKTSLARQAEVEKEHQPRVNPVLEIRLGSSELVSQNLPQTGAYNAKGEIIEDHDYERQIDFQA